MENDMPPDWIAREREATDFVVNSSMPRQVKVDLLFALTMLSQCEFNTPMESRAAGRALYELCESQ